MAREQKWPHGSPQARSIDERTLGAARDRIVRNNSVFNDIRLDLPVSIQRLEEEERPRRSPCLPPSGYDSRSEIQRPYIKPPPNKTVCCIPDPEGKNRKGGGGPSCSSCRPATTTTLHQSNLQKNAGSATGNSSGWGLSWSRGNKSPPSSHPRHHRQQHQRHIQSSTSTNNPIPSHPWSSSSPAPCSGVNVKPQKSSTFVPPVGVISSFLAGVITSSSEKGNGSQQYKDNVINSVKSITQTDGLYGPDLAKFRCISERKPVKNDRPSPTCNVNSSVCSSGPSSKQIGDSSLNSNYSRILKYDDDESGHSPPRSPTNSHFLKNLAPSTTDAQNFPTTTRTTTPSPESYSYSTTDNFPIFENADSDRQRCKKFDRKGHHRKGRQGLTQPQLLPVDESSGGHGFGDTNINMHRHNNDTDPVKTCGGGLPHHNHNKESKSNYERHSDWTSFETLETPSSSTTMTDHQQLLQYRSTQPSPYDENLAFSSNGESSVQEETGSHYYSPSEPAPPTNHQLIDNRYCTTATSVGSEPHNQHLNSGCHLK